MRILVALFSAPLLVYSMDASLSPPRAPGASDSALRGGASGEGGGNCELTAGVNTCVNVKTVNAEGESLKFNVLMLGVKGGITEENLSSYAVTLASKPEKKYVLFDGGSIHAGLQKARQKGNFGLEDGADEAEGDFWGTELKACLIGHTHLDHLSGLLIAMTEKFMGRKHKFYGLKWVLDHLKSSMFNDVLWPR